MGLDSYAYSVLPELANGDFDIKEDSKLRSPEEFQYWRKNRVIHDFMTELYKKKGGTEKCFNCIYLRLTLEDLNELEKFIKETYSDECSDLFFHSNEFRDWGYETDTKFIETARDIITKEGNCVYYYSWW